MAGEGEFVVIGRLGSSAHGPLHAAASQHSAAFPRASSQREPRWGLWSLYKMMLEVVPVASAMFFSFKVSQ